MSLLPPGQSTRPITHADGVLVCTGVNSYVMSQAMSLDFLVSVVANFELLSKVSIKYLLFIVFL